MPHPFAILTIALLLQAAAPVDPGLDVLFALDQRVATIGYRLATANVDLCEKRGAQTGLILHSFGQYGPNARIALASRFTAGGHPSVQSVVDDGAAQRAGLMPDDAISAINGVPTPDQLTGAADYAVVQETEDRLETALNTPPATLSIARKGQRLTIALTGEAGCASRFQIVPGKKLNASADGTYVQLTGNAANFAANDDELAMLIAHEFAHNVLQHRALLGRIGRTRRNIRETEGDADYWGLYLLVRAGYNGSEAIKFWDRFERRTNAGFFADGTHLSRKDRIALAATTLAEIKAKQARGIALIPEKRLPL